MFGYPKPVLTLSGFTKFHLSWTSHTPTYLGEVLVICKSRRKCVAASPFLNRSLHFGAKPSVCDVHLLPHFVSCG